MTNTIYAQSIFLDATDTEGVKVLHRHTERDPGFGAGAVWFDCDGDSDLDLFVANRGANSLFRNNRIGLGTPDFTDITTPVIADAGRDGSGAAAADYDNDGDMDLFLTNYEEDILLQNDGTGNFTDVTTVAFPGIAPFQPQFGSSAAWGDLNNDGWLDLYISNYDHVDSTIVPSDYLFISNGGFPVTFTDRSELLSGDADHDGINDLNGYGLAAIITDVNNDGWMDIFATNDCPLGPEGNKLWINNGDLTFTESIGTIGPFTRGITTPECSDVMGITRGDPNHDGWLDYHMTNVHVYGENTVLLQNNGVNLLNVSGPAGLDKVNFTPESGLLFTWGTNFIDYDLDTWQDIAFAGGSLRDVYQPNFLYHNETTDIGGIPQFTQVDRNTSGIVNGASTRTMIMGDYDMDGDPDLFTVNFDANSSLYRNENNNGNHWLIVDLKGAGAPLSNLNGIGAKIRVTTPDNLVQYYEIYSGSSLGGGDDVAAYFGLAEHESFDLEITWPSGIRQVLTNLESNQRLLIQEPMAKVMVGGGEKFLIRENEYEVTWKSIFDSDVRIELYKSGVFDRILAESVPNSGNFTWMPGAAVSSGQDYTVRIVSMTDGDHSGSSKKFSLIDASANYSFLVSPSGGELLEQGQSYEITWDGPQEGSVSLDLYSGNSFIQSIATDIPDNGSHAWVVPNTLEGNNYYVKLTGSDGFSDKNDLSFSVVKEFLEFSVPDLPEINADRSHARIWNEMLLEAIRNDFARPTVHARNLFHISAAMYDAWAAFDPKARTYFLGNTVHGFTFPFGGIAMPLDIKRSQQEAISFAAYRLLKHRFKNSPGASEINEQADILLSYLGYDKTNTSVDYSDGSPAALGNYIASLIIDYGLQDGSNEENGYANLFYEPVNPPFNPLGSGVGDMQNPNRWQPLSFDIFIDQSGNEIPGKIPPFLSPEWGMVLPFSLKESELDIYERDGNEYWVYHDPGPPAFLDPATGQGDSEYYKWGFELVSEWSSHLDPYDGVMWDISPASQGNIQVLPESFTSYDQFYNALEGGDQGQGYDVNPATGAPYEPQLVPRGDYVRVLAEFWADGPDSETPPGHWFTILNYVNDHPAIEKKFEGTGRALQALEWDIKAYFILGGAMHDVAITSWGIKGFYDYVRPISAIRYLCQLGQSSDPELPNYNQGGVELVPGFIEVVTEGDPLAGLENENIGKIKVKAWRGHQHINDPATDEAGVGWVLGDDWIPYQRPSFVTPPFAGYVSGHSTYSRAAAEIMTLLTGDEYFPGGMSEFVAPKNDFLVFEKGPSTDVVLQWAKYRDASDQCSLSRIWGGIHPPVDDIAGRKIGAVIGVEAFNFAKAYFDAEVVTSVALPGRTEVSIYPNPLDDSFLNIRIGSPHQAYQLMVHDLNGHTVLNSEIPGNTGQIDMSGLRPGLYILRLTNNSEEITRKLIKR